MPDDVLTSDSDDEAEAPAPLFRARLYGAEADEDDADVLVGARPVRQVLTALCEGDLKWKWETAATAPRDGRPLATTALVVGFNGPGEHALDAVFPIKRRLGALTVPPVPHLYGEETAVEGQRASKAPEDAVCELFGVDERNTALVMLCRGPIPVERAFHWAAVVMASVSPQSITLLESLRPASYIVDREVMQEDEAVPPLLRVLHTSSAGRAPIAPFLESPNVVEGPSAALLTHCQLRNIPGRMYLSLLEARDADAQMTLPTLLAFEPALLRLPLAEKNNVGEVLRKYHRAWSRRMPRRTSNPLYLRALAALATVLRWTETAAGAADAVLLPLLPAGGVDAKLPPVNCGVCGHSRRVHACLQCVSLACGGAHIAAHLAEQQHNFALDLTSKSLFCLACRDYVYDTDFERLVRQQQRALYDEGLSARAYTWSLDSGRVLKRARYQLASLSERDRDAIRRDGVVRKCSGLRGLYNLGSTCFMNSILQALLHNPLMRSYFLTDGHNPRTCPIRQQQDPQAAVVCLACLTDDLFMQCFSGQEAPFAPHQFLHAMWTFSSELAGYEQQDAHEFFITVLNGLHSHCNGSPSDCTCVVHRVFKGILKSDVTCLNCGNVSTARDPFFDISVALTSRSNGHGDDDDNNALMDCLRRFTRPERLGSTDVRCDNCGGYQASTKQLSIWMAPCVLTIHIKRFEHSAASSLKIDTFSAFPTSLNLGPFISANLSGAASDAETPPRLPKALLLGYDYALFAVITHLGTLESGHYVIYVLSNEQWFKIDDDKVTKVHGSEVLQTNAYMLFYVKRQLDFMTQQTAP